MQTEINRIYCDEGARLINKALKEDINVTSIPFEKAKEEALKLWREGWAWPTYNDIPAQERNQDFIRRKCNMLFGLKAKPDCYAFSVLCLLGPIHLCSKDLNEWGDCYDFIDFDEEQGMFKRLDVSVEQGHSMKCTCSHHITNLYEITCKDIFYDNDGSIDNIEMRGLHLGSICIHKRSIVPKIRQELNKKTIQGDKFNDDMLKKMVYELAKKDKKKCNNCGKLNVGFTSKFENCRECRKKIKRMKEITTRLLQKRLSIYANVEGSWKVKFGKYKGQYWSDVIKTDRNYVLWAQKNVFSELFVDDLIENDKKGYWKRFEFDHDKLNQKVWYNLMFQVFVQESSDPGDTNVEIRNEIDKLILNSFY